MTERPEPSARNEPPDGQVPGAAGASAAGARADGARADGARPAARPRPGTGRPGRPSLGWTELVVGVLVYLVLLALVLAPATQVLIGLGAPPGIALTAVAPVTALIAAVAALAVRVRWAPALGIRSTTLRWLLVAVAAGLLTKVVTVGAILAYQALTGDRSNPQEVLTNSAAGGGWQLAGLLLFGAVLVPLGEELLFRGLIYGSLRRYGVLLGLIVSSVLFGLAHGLNAVLVAAVVLGAVNVVLYERSRSIWVPMLSHTMFNASAFVLAAVLM
ncbi:MAG: CPBP family intramembrane metalloprotease [Pseudonocardia sp.]|nr:CPBP family intramembrane metalloprotease [Pseudonocardia sp.]